MDATLAFLLAWMLILIFVSTTELKFLSYKPSEHEQEFKDLVEKINPIDGCVVWNNKSELSILAKKSSRHGLYKKPSKLLFQDASGSISVKIIEPLTSFLRSHTALTTGHQTRNSIMDKEYYHFPKKRDLYNENGQLRRIIFFDLGASMFSSGAGGDAGASQQWFWKKYQEITGVDLPFAAVYAWEKIVYDPSKLWYEFPDKVIPFIHYYNVPVDATPGAKMNPWRFLPLVTSPSDYVIVKLDIDHQPTELALVNQLLDPSTGYAKLIDEFFWEHHVSGSALTCPELWGQGRGMGWSKMKFDVSAGSNETLAASYRIFTKLREMGIRAHSWV